METIKISGHIGENNSFASLFGGDVNFSSSELSDLLGALDSEEKELSIEIRSDGGNVRIGYEIFDLLNEWKNAVPGRKITTKAYRANSIATVIFLAGDERLISENANFLIHNARIDFESYPGLLTAEDLKAFAEELDSISEKIFETYIDVLKIEDETIKAQIRDYMNRDEMIPAEEVIRLGFATGKINSTPNASNFRSFVYSDLIAAKLEEKTNSKKMNKFEEILSKIENSLSKLVKNEGPEIKNGSFYLIDGETEIYFEGDEIIPGQTMVFLDEQLTTAAPDGEHTLQDGRILVVSAGMAVEILAPQAKIDQLKTDLQNANERIASLENEFSKKLEEVQNKLTDVLNKVPGSGKIENQFENKNLTAAQKHRANRRTI